MISSPGANKNKSSTFPASEPTDNTAQQSDRTQQLPPNYLPPRVQSAPPTKHIRDSRSWSWWKQHFMGLQRRITGSINESPGQTGSDSGIVISSSLQAMTNNAHPSDPTASPGQVKAAAVDASATVHIKPGPPLEAPTVELANRIEEYNSKRAETVQTEAAMAFDHMCRENATDAEKLADRILLRLKKQDETGIFAKADMRDGYGNQRHKPFPGDHYLSNISLIEATDVFRAARHAPKGAHLHIHYNACLKPRVLLDLAARMDRMFITSDLPLVFSKDSGDAPHKNFYSCEIQFQITSVKDENPGNLFSPEYHDRQHMQFCKFLAEFPEKDMKMSAMDWLVSKLVFNELETYDIPQTASGAWECFNARTRMMKGLFNYETVYRKYTKRFLRDLIADNIQYAEIRPNFMPTNQLWNDDGTAKLDNGGIVKLIIDACENFKASKAGKHNFDGIKIIYCTPRSFSNDQVQLALEECFEFKRKWPNYIAGFDLVGQEGKGHPLHHFVPEFLAFKDKCSRHQVDIPFLFHCGETLDMGTEVDGNLFDALLLDAKRIGHGFALPRHPHILEEMKHKNVCVEVCPISNEILGLTPRIGGHTVYSLLAQNIPCTINSDNGTLFQSSLSHDFYQILVGKADMGLFGWRQLAEWSLEHSCLDEEDTKCARESWLKEWREYIFWLLKEYADDTKEEQDVLAEIRQDRTKAARASCP